MLRDAELARNTRPFFLCPGAVVRPETRALRREAELGNKVGC